ncbi:ADP-ribose glycohydrolase OARD1-like isoform X2 [Gigantopelta aegis]|uniref:ADP-ribose glycohydrolase OARD1-like isoform X2 n=1 Tax=Gigantopelta aegis TaxID=1735272 RepID=UPI001B88C8FE|nr:ADP-ribose glycohydrolase OARD1-like isoform X2 [Gigantopelta aegis]
MAEAGLHEVKGDLFKCPETSALAHCISEDIRMGKGIAVIFKNKFGGIQELKNQGKSVGSVAVLKRGQRYVYYLITKKKYSDKPTYDTMRSSLVAMKEHCVAHDVKSVCMPLIGCGLDRLQWAKVAEIICEVFSDTDVSVSVYSL